MKRKLARVSFLIVLLSFLINYISGVPVFVNIRDTLEGHFPINNISISKGVINVNAIWENLGSVTCDTYLRVDVLDNESEVIDTFWSNMEEVTPGDSAYYRVFIYLHNYTGNISLRQRFYYCNEISQLKEFNLSYNTTNIKMGGKEMNISHTLINNNTLKIKIRINSSINGSIYVLPQKTPIGWIVESRKIEVRNGQGEGEIFIEKPVKSEKELNMYLLLASANQTREYRKKISIIAKAKKKEKGYRWPLIISLALNILLLLTIAFLLRNKYKSKGKNESKKRESKSKRK